MLNILPRRAPRLRHAIVAALLIPACVSAQERLLGLTTVSTGVFYENWSLPTAVPTTTASGGSSLISGASQFTFPLAVVVPLTEGWTVDAYSALVQGTVRQTSATGGPGRSIQLNGLTDTRLRVVGQLVGDALVLTAGVTAPTGKTGLTDEQRDALAIISAPGLRFRSPGLGAGAGATLGLIAARQVSGWGMALGTSFEMRGTYAPAEALQVNQAASDLRPGNAVHLSLAGERVAGAIRHTLSIGGDVYQAGELRDRTAGGNTSALTLGPSITGTYQLDASTGQVESSTFIVARHRGAYSVAGQTAEGSGRTEIEAGSQLLRALTPSYGLRLALEGRVQTTSATPTSEGGTGVGFATAGVQAVGGTVAVRMGPPQGALSIEPFARVQAGRLDFSSTTRTITGLSGGVTLTTRF